MSENNSETFVLVKDANGDKFLCPLDTVKDISSVNVDDTADCVAEDVVGRYAGNIKKRTS
jgi:hypothetical protein